MTIKADHNESTTGADASVEALILTEAIRHEATTLIRQKLYDMKLLALDYLASSAR